MQGKFLIIFLVFIVFVMILPNSSAQSPYSIQIDDNEFEIHYSVDADVIAMDIDREQKSLLIGLDNTKESIFSLHLPDEMISAEENEFAVLVDWVEVDYKITELQYIQAPEVPVTVVEFYVPEGTIEVEIIGTHVIPEFPIGVIGIMAALMTVTIIALRKSALTRL